MKLQLLLLVLCATLAVVPLRSEAQQQLYPVKSYYVAPSASGGSDANPGTVGAPFLTIKKALDRVKEFKGLTPNWNISIKLRGGEYRLTQTLVITREHTVNDATSLTITAYESSPGVYEPVLIYGGQNLNGWGDAWLETSPGSHRWYKTGLNSVFSSPPLNLLPPTDDTAFDVGRMWEFRDLYFGNVRLPRARFPDSGYVDVVDSGCTGVCPTQGVLADYPCGRWYRVGGEIPFPLGSYSHKRVEVVARRGPVHPRQIVVNLGGSPSYYVYTAPQWPLGLTNCFKCVRSDTHPYGGQPDSCMRAGRAEDWPGDLHEPYPGYDPSGKGWGWPCNPPFEAAHPCTGDGVHHDQVYLENALSFLNAEYEWFFDSRAPDGGRLDVILPAGVEPWDHSMIVPCLDRLFVVKGSITWRDFDPENPDYERSSYTPVKNVHFKNLNLAFTHHPIQNEVNDLIIDDGGSYADHSYYADRGYATGQTGHRRNWNSAEIPNRNFMPAAVQLFAADECSVRSCRIAHTGAGGLQLLGHNNTIDGNEIFDIGASGVHVGVFGPAYRPWLAPKGPVVEDNVISNNHIHGFGRVYQDCVGILEAFANRTKIVHNEVACGPYAGISSGWNWGCRGVPNSTWYLSDGETPVPNGDQGWGTQIHYNFIHNVMLLSTDGGAIYVPGNHTNVNQATECDSGCWTINARYASEFGSMIGNWIRGVHKDSTYGAGNKASGIYLEQGSRGWHLAGNVIEDVDYVVHINTANNGAPTDWKYHSWRQNLRPEFTDYEQNAIPASAWLYNFYSLPTNPLSDCNGYAGSTDCQTGDFGNRYPFEPILISQSENIAQFFSSYTWETPGSPVNEIMEFAGPLEAYHDFFEVSEQLIHGVSPAPQPCE